MGIFKSRVKGEWLGKTRVESLHELGIAASKWRKGQKLSCCWWITAVEIRVLWRQREETGVLVPHSSDQIGSYQKALLETCRHHIFQDWTVAHQKNRRRRTDMQQLKQDAWILNELVNQCQWWNYSEQGFQIAFNPKIWPEVRWRKKVKKCVDKIE